MLCQVFCDTSKLKSKRNATKSFALHQLAHKCAAVSTGARPNHMLVESSCFCFPKELVSLVRPRARDNRKTHLSWKV